MAIALVDSDLAKAVQSQFGLSFPLSLFPELSDPVQQRYYLVNKAKNKAIACNVGSVGSRKEYSHQID
jgi:hypothetical protein